MRTLEELKAFYASGLLADIKVIEAQRKKTLQTLLFLLIPLLILTAVLTAWASYTGGLSEDNDLPMIILGFGGFAALGIYHFITRSYVNDFKSTILPKIVEFVDGNLRYAKDQCISETEFVQCQIFLKDPDVYRGDDLVNGTLGQTAIKFSEIHAQYVTRGRKGRRHYHTIFKGLLFAADFNKNFNGKTFVLPDTAEKLFWGMGTVLQSWNAARPPLVKLEDPEFEKMFVVYADDQVEARYILSTSLMKRIVDFKNKTKRSIGLSFIHSKVYVAIPYSRNLFEPRVFRTLLDFQPIQQYFEDLELAVSIVEDLNLNLRIWSKQ